MHVTGIAAGPKKLTKIGLCACSCQVTMTIACDIYIGKNIGEFSFFFVSS